MSNEEIFNIEEDEDEDEDLEVETITDPVTGQKKYKRKYGSGVKRATEEKKAQCPICKRYYKRVNEAHLISIHNMTVEELRIKNPELVPYFTVSNYAVENSEHAQFTKELREEIMRSSEPVDNFSKIEKNVSDMLDNLSNEYNFDRTDPNFLETPKRVAKAFKEILKGMNNTDEQLKDIFKEASTFPSDYPGIVVETNIRAYGKCPHHLETISYNIHIGYKPKYKKIGLSKLARCAAILCSRLKMQEDVTHDIATAIMKYLDAEGVAVAIDATHDCMRIRGCRQDNVATSSSVLLGCFLYDHNIRNEFYQNINRNAKGF